MVSTPLEHHITQHMTLIVPYSGYCKSRTITINTHSLTHLLFVRFSLVNADTRAGTAFIAGLLALSVLPATACLGEQAQRHRALA